MSTTPGAQPFDSKTSPTEPAPAVPPGDVEEVYFQGSPPVRAFSGTVFLCCLFAAVLIAGAIALQVEHMGPPLLRLILCIVGLAALPIPLIMARCTYYRITNYRIDFGRGLLARDIDTLELWHVEDLHFHQSLMDRVLNVGDITILSHDEVLPKLDIHGVPNPKALYEELKQRVISVKRQRGVIKMDQG
jgi:hypothetical protein